MCVDRSYVDRCRSLLFVIVVTTFVTGCAIGPARKTDGSVATGQNAEATETTTTPEEEGLAKTLEEAGTEKAGPPASLSTHARAAAIENQSIDSIIRTEEPNTQELYDNSRYDFPITMNSKVEGWIDYFTGRGREHMERYLSRSARYIPAMKEILKKQGLPQDLVYLALIESGFNLRAKSRTRAVGPWQFMKPTGKRYGLRVDAWIDERSDFIRSTEAAGRYLKDLYLMFESWYLAASAYNAGEYKLLRAVEGLKTNNFWRICETKMIRRETKDYIPKLIAAAIIGKNPKRYGFESVVYEKPLSYEVVTVDFAVDLKEIAKIIDASLQDIEDLNPELVQSAVPPGYGPYELRVPKGARTLVERAVTQLKSKLVLDTMPKQHVVRSGETLRSVANRYRVPFKTFANFNNMSHREKVTPGTKLLVPTGAAAAPPPRTARARRSVSNRDNDDYTPAAGYVTHTVRSGESLWTISEKYEVTVQQIFRWNNLKKSRIFPGKRLKIKARGSSTTESATDSRAPVRRRHSRQS